MALSRRDFIKRTLATTTVASFAPAVPSLFVNSCSGAVGDDSKKDRVLIVVQLTGGNDGLNSVVPYGDDEYGRSRPTIALPAAKLHKIDSMSGFHPQMEAFSRLYKEGRLSIVQGVGCPNNNRDHENAMRIWHCGDPDYAARRTGWLGRVADAADNRTKSGTPVAMVSAIHKPFVLNARNAIIPAVRSLDDLTIKNVPERGRRASSPDDKNPLLNLVRQRSMSSYAMSGRIKDIARTKANIAEYPQLTLAENFRMIAQLVRAEAGIRVFFTELGGEGFGGFDNHANQIGNHCALLGQLSESVAAFVADLAADKLLDRVLLMTFSEFGRTVKENGRRGTGHGEAAPVFLIGGRLKGGLIGQRPSLADLDNGAPKFHIDFRRLYATVLDEWLGFDSKVVLGGQFDTLKFLDI